MPNVPAAYKVCLTCTALASWRNTGAIRRKPVGRDGDSAAPIGRLSFCFGFPGRVSPVFLRREYLGENVKCDRTSCNVKASRFTLFEPPPQSQRALFGECVQRCRRRCLVVLRLGLGFLGCEPHGKVVGVLLHRLSFRG